ncbi:hypothetical protein MKW98_011330 [Papaver atlanticum]|uniref:Uncharacterized protein n=1 Tax=Papaver atlanticum TaxID=357466 RepID=A0AAD4SVQ9_9MAGN|nr:hypothetical protein MKW98_011330 [Papaver atlanticum]
MFLGHWVQGGGTNTVFFLSYTPSAICSLHGCCIIQIQSGRSRLKSLVQVFETLLSYTVILRVLDTSRRAKSLLAAIIKVGDAHFGFLPAITSPLKSPPGVRNLSCSTSNDGMQNRSECNVHKGEHQFEGNL